MLLKSGICFTTCLIMTGILLVPSVLNVCTACNCDQSGTASIGGISDPADNGLGNTSEQSLVEEGSPVLAGYNDSSMLAEYNDSSMLIEYNDSSILVDKGGVGNITII
jgi:hypothetical protein